MSLIVVLYQGVIVMAGTLQVGVAGCEVIAPAQLEVSKRVVVEAGGDPADVEVKCAMPGSIIFAGQEL